MLRLFVLLFCVFVGSIHAINAQGGYKFFENVDGWLKLHRVPATWDDARRTCQSEGGIIAAPTSEHMLTSLKELLNDQRATCGVFTGLNSIYTKGSYYSIDGVPLSKIPVGWAVDSGNNQANAKCSESFKECLTLLPDGSLSDTGCNTYFPYICYKGRNQTKECDWACGSENSGYNLDSRTGSCYKFHLGGHTWTEAAETCVLEGGYLAIINSHAEAGVLRELFSKHPPNTLDSDMSNSAMLGFLDWGKRGSWATIHGQTLEEAGYAAWSPGQPDNNKEYLGHPGQYCGAMYRTALLDDVWCDVKMAFICEKTAVLGSNYN